MDKKDFSRIKALAVDLDGTLLRPDNSLSERTIHALKGCQKRGLKIIICTGRSPEASEAYRVALDARGPMVYFNGAEITNMPDGAPFYPALLRLEAVDFCVDISRSTGAYFQVYIPETAETPRKVLVAEKSTDETVMYFNHTGTRTVIGDLKQLLATPGLTGCIKAMFLTSPALQEVICSRLLEKFGESISVARTLSTFLEVMASGVSKGEGLRRVLEQCNLRPDEVLAFGDEENDLPLFAAAGFSVAPANAKESVRDAANMLIAPNAEDGVAAFLEDTFTGA